MSTKSNEQCCVHAFISGRVQGVWYRAFTKEQAIKAGVNGWAKNLADGRVEVMLAGYHQDVEQVISTLYDGPALAKVTGIEKEILRYRDFEGFSTA